MGMLQKRLIIEQLDRKIDEFKSIRNGHFTNGWIHSVRTAINMSLKQLGERLSVTKQSVKGIEDREKDGSITLKSLKAAGEALDMKLVYGFIPKTGSIEKMIQVKATEVATWIVLRASNNMSLEDQKVSDDRLEQAIKDRIDDILYKMPKYLWD